MSDRKTYDEILKWWRDKGIKDHVTPFTWAHYGFESVIIGRKEG